MNQLKISTRLTVAFAVMVLLLIALGAVSLIQSASQRAELKDVIDVRIPITKALGALTDGVNEQAKASDLVSKNLNRIVALMDTSEKALNKNLESTQSILEVAHLLEQAATKFRLQK